MQWKTINLINVAVNLLSYWVLMFDTFCNIIPHNGNQVVVKCEFLSYVGIPYFNFSYYTIIIKLDTREKKEALIMNCII